MCCAHIPPFYRQRLPEAYFSGALDSVLVAADGAITTCGAPKCEKEQKEAGVVGLAGRLPVRGGGLRNDAVPHSDAAPGCTGGALS